MINKSRLEALSDAIIAILMTIMALQIEVPTGIKLSSLKRIQSSILSRISLALLLQWLFGTTIIAYSLK